MKKRVANLVEFKVTDQKNTLCMTFRNVTLSSMYSVMDCLRQCEKELVDVAKNEGYISMPCRWVYHIVDVED